MFQLGFSQTTKVRKSTNIVISDSTMVKLTEDMIVARTRVSDMNHVKKLNCWGAELSDISVLRKLTHVEALSLRYSLQKKKIPLKICKIIPNLLYTRKNQIPDIS